MTESPDDAPIDDVPDITELRTMQPYPEPADLDGNHDSSPDEPKPGEETPGA